MTRARAGFTLLEIMVSLAILGVIAVLTWSTMGTTLKIRDYLAEENVLDRSARIALDRITRELQLAYLTESVTAVNTYRTVFVGQDGNETDSIWFATLAHHRTVRDSRECDQTEITLWTEDDPENRGRQVLLHREAPRVDQEPDKDGVISPLATSVNRFELRYLDPTTNEWRDDWDTAGTETPNRLPRAVQVVLTLLGPDPDDESRVIEHPYITTVMVERASRLKRGLFSNGGGG